jgi:60S ribosome subunit biogenesis protein NIP7
MYRGLKKNELTIFRRAMDGWGAFDMLKEIELIVRQSEKNDVFACTPEVKYYAIGREKEPVLAGIFLGTFTRKQFNLSIEGAYLIGRYSDKKKIFVNGQAESLVLYGRDVFGTSITRGDEGILQNDKVIIANRFGEAIGMGLARFDYDRLFDDKVTVNNKGDMGLYIREQDNVSGGTDL